ncbi:hypothetical protein BT69DRAFT_1316316 [Atractiella rhizophila]|nr:hypothetical protein BT69DRAFT_1316316 [Atractiella rhizophila]
MTSDKQKHKASKLEQFQLPQDPNAPDIIRLVHRFAAVVDAFPSNLMKTLGDLKELDAVLNVSLSSLTDSLHDFEGIIDAYEADRLLRLKTAASAASASATAPTSVSPKPEVVPAPIAERESELPAMDVDPILPTQLHQDANTLPSEQSNPTNVESKVAETATPQLERLKKLRELADLVRKIRPTADERGLVALRGVEVVRSQTHSLDVISTMLTALLPPSILPKLPAPSTPQGYPRLFAPYKSYSHNSTQLKLPSAVGTEGFPLNMGELNNELYNLPLPLVPQAAAPNGKGVNLKNAPATSKTPGASGGGAKKPATGAKRTTNNSNVNNATSSRGINANGTAQSPTSSAYGAAAVPPPSRRGGRTTRTSTADSNPPSIAPKGSSQPHRSSNLNPNSERGERGRAASIGGASPVVGGGKEEGRKRTRGRSPLQEREDDGSNKRKKKNGGTSSSASADPPDVPSTDYTPATTAAPQAIPVSYPLTNVVPVTQPPPQSIWNMDISMPRGPEGYPPPTYDDPAWGTPANWRPGTIPGGMSPVVGMGSMSNQTSPTSYPIHPPPSTPKHTEDEGERKEWCFCEGRGHGDEMVGCDNEKSCDIEWYHLSCLGLKAVPQGHWICPECIRKGVGKKSAAGNGRRKAHQRNGNGTNGTTAGTVVAAN